MRLIDADNLEDVVTKANEQEFGITRNEFKRIELVISEFPTVDTEPVRHGSWVGIDDFPHEDWECTNCGYIIYGDDDIRDLHYCPNCGAKMYGGENG